MKTVWKYPIEVADGEQLLRMKAPVERLLRVGVDPQGTVCLWAMVDTVGPPDDLNYEVVGTGHPIRTWGPDDYRGSVAAGPFVWHVFAEIVRR